jgi:hypothetical protein
VISFERVKSRLILVCGFLFAANAVLSQSTPSSGASSEKFFVNDRSRLPPALRQVRLEHLSSGALMLLNHDGDLVRPPAAWLARAADAAAIAALSEVALDPRVGSNLRLGDDPSTLPPNLRAQAEPHIARSQASSNFLVATFQEGRFTTSGAVDCGYSVTTDGGLSWSRALIPNLTVTSGGRYSRATDPVAGIDLNGSVYLNTLGAIDQGFTRAAILVSRSTDGGATFGAPATVYRPRKTTVFPDKPWMAINTFANTNTAGRILVTFTLFSNLNRDGGSIRRAFSDNGGISWSNAGRVNLSVKNAQGSQPVYLPNGNAVVVYWNFGTRKHPGERLEALISEDGGTTFGSPRLIANAIEYAEPSIRSGVFLPSAAADRTNGYIYVVYQTLVGGNPRIVFTKSVDGGNTWTVPIAISDNPSGSGVFNATINVSPDGQRVTTVFYDHRDNPGSNVLVDIYLAQSFDGGTTWQPNIRLSSVSSNASLAPLTASGYMLGDYLGIAESTASNVPAVPVWIDTRTGNPDPFVTRVTISP